MRKKDNGTAMRITDFSKDFLNNVRATRRSVVKGKVIDKEMLTQAETLDLITNYFKLNNDKYIELINMEYKKDA